MNNIQALLTFVFLQLLWLRGQQERLWVCVETCSLEEERGLLVTRWGSVVIVAGIGGSWGDSSSSHSSLPLISIKELCNLWDLPPQLDRAVVPTVRTFTWQLRLPYSSRQLCAAASLSGEQLLRCHVDKRTKLKNSTGKENAEAEQNHFASRVPFKFVLEAAAALPENGFPESLYSHDTGGIEGFVSEIDPQRHKICHEIDERKRRRLFIKKSVTEELSIYVYN